MNPERSYSSILANLSRNAPLDLDPLIFDPSPAGQLSAPEAASFAPSKAIWDLPDGGPSRLGVRFRTRVPDADVLAARLAAIAVERQIHPVFLSYISNCEMQRFGFRVEQLYGLSEPAQVVFETQLARFWRFALIIDASEISRLR
jgi:hypothetical protein